jgi:hypothetical protein
MSRRAAGSLSVSVLEPQVEAISDQLSQTKPVTLGGAIAMLQHECVEELIAPVIEGLRDMQAKGARQEKPDVIGFGEPEEGGAA